MRTLSAIMSLTAVIFLAGCTTPLTTREKGLGIGALGGAAAGAIVGSTVGHPAAGALIGGALGAGAGGLIGDQLQGRQQQEEELQRRIDEQERILNEQRRELERLRCLKTQKFNRELCTY